MEVKTYPVEWNKGEPVELGEHGLWWQAYLAALTAMCSGVKPFQSDFRSIVHAAAKFAELSVQAMNDRWWSEE